MSQCYESQTDRGTFLIIDDSRDLVSVLENWLRECGYQVRVATTGRRGLKMARDLTPQVILADLCLPDMSGLTLCQTLKTEDSTRAVPIIVVSAFEDHEEDARAVGVEAFVLKPFHLETLLTAFQQIGVPLDPPSETCKTPTNG